MINKIGTVVAVSLLDVWEFTPTSSQLLYKTDKAYKYKCSSFSLFFIRLNCFVLW